MKSKTLLIVFASFCCLLQRLDCAAQLRNTSDIIFVQGDSTFNITHSYGSVKLLRQPFSARFFAKQYEEKNNRFFAVQVVVLDPAADTPLIYNGQPIADLPFFEEGTGMAAGVNGYDTIFISNEGHHYLYYQNEKDNRAKLLSRHNGLLELEWNIAGAYYMGKDLGFSDLKLPRLCFVFVTDHNLNGILDDKEWKLIYIDFKE